MFGFIKRLIFRYETFGSIRSPKWRKIRKLYIKRHPACEISGKKKKLEVHHKKPVHLFPELELEISNLITLEKKYHFIFGHLGDYFSYNPNIDEDVKIWSNKIKNKKT